MEEEKPKRGAGLSSDNERGGVPLPSARPLTSAMTRRQFVKTGAWGLGGALAWSLLGKRVALGAPPPGGRPLNLLVIISDQMRHDMLAATGNTVIQMPNLNRLASQSVVFERCYAAQPLCSPSRGAMLTGLYPHSSGVYGNNVMLAPERLTVPEMVGGEYATMYCGKWHLGDEVFAQQGFQQWVSTEDQYRKFFSPGRDPATRSSYNHWLTEHGVKPGNAEENVFGRQQAARLPEELGKPAFQAQRASQFIKENRDRPFILYVSFLEPHTPYFGPRDDQYDPAKVTLPKNFNIRPPDDHYAQAPKRYDQMHKKGTAAKDGVQPLKTEADWRRLIARYWGNCSLVDTYAGAVLKTLEEQGLMDNTVIVFTADHGDLMGSHGLTAKTLVYEEAARVPLLIRRPGQTKMQRVSNAVGNIGLAPTILELMGKDLPAHLQGRSLVPLMDGKAIEAEDVFIENAGLDEEDKTPCDESRTIVSQDGWKCTWERGATGERVVLFNLNKDPQELTNVAREPGNQELLRRLRARMLQWQERTKDPFRLPGA